MNMKKDNHKFHCRECSKGFSRSTELERHMKTHTGEKPFNCEVCDKAFSQRSNLKRHMLVHTGEKAFTCEICSKSFALRDNLKTHMVFHSDNRDFQCKVCLKRFLLGKDLEAHRVTHTGEKPFLCHLCPKSFSFAAALQRHQKAHLGAKPFMCEHCPRAFGRRENLLAHVESQHASLGVKCDVCVQSFPSRSELRSHKRVHKVAKLQTKPAVHSKTDSRDKHPTEDNSTSSDTFKFENPPNEIGKCAIDKDRLHCHSKVELDASYESAIDSCQQHNDLSNEPLIGVGLFSTLDNETSHALINEEEDNDPSRATSPKSEILADFPINCDTKLSSHPKKCDKDLKEIANNGHVMEQHDSEDHPSMDVKDNKGTHLPDDGDFVGSETFRCANCEVKFDNEFELNIHQEAMLCPLYTEKLFVDIGSLQVNQIRKSGKSTCHVGKYKKRENGAKNVLKYSRHSCASCEESFPSAILLQKYGIMCPDIASIERNPDTKPFQCDVCNEYFDNQSLFIAHVDKHKIKRKLMCHICSKLFSTSRYLKDHLKGHDGERPYECEICPKKFFNEAHKKAHVAIHSGSRPYMCDVCPCSFVQQSSLVRHKRVHNGDKPFQCLVCTRRFSRKEYRDSHMRIHKPEASSSQSSGGSNAGRTTSHTCDICEKTFPFSQTLHKHRIAEHTSPSSNQVASAPDLPAGVTAESSRTAAPTAAFPNQQRPFGCETCGKVFRIYNSLIVHQRIHTGERPYQCDICAKRFIQLVALKRHKSSVHSEEKPFTCDICYKSFALEGYLAEHKFTHAPEKMFKCRECDKSFASRSTLSKHRKTHSQL